jgi:hypothetical protein
MMIGCTVKVDDVIAFKGGGLLGNSLPANGVNISGILQTQTK